MNSAEIALALRRKVPEGIKARTLEMAPYEHDATSITYRVVMPATGTIAGVHLTKDWPAKSAVLRTRWVSGENVIVRTLEHGVVPASLLRLMRFWGSKGEALEVQFSVQPRNGLTPRQVALRHRSRPVILLVLPVESVWTNAVRWVSGGLARLGRATDGG